MGALLCVTVLLLLLSLSSSSNFAILLTMCLRVGFFGFILFGIFCAFWSYVSFSLTRLRKFTAIISSTRFSIPCSFSYPSDTLMMQMLLYCMLSEMSLRLFSFKNSFFLFFLCLGIFCVFSL